MSVTVKIQCQKCEVIHEVELDCVVVLGYTDTQVVLWYHDVSEKDMLDLMGQSLQHLAKEEDS